MRRSLPLVLAFALGALSIPGCATPPPSQAAVDAAPFGPAPLAHRSEIREAVSRTLANPATAQLRFEEPARAVVENGDRGDGLGGGWVAGWIVPTGVKALGTHGEYSPFLPRIYFFPAGGGVFPLRPDQRILLPGAERPSPGT